MHFGETIEAGHEAYVQLTRRWLQLKTADTTAHRRKMARGAERLSSRTPQRLDLLYGEARPYALHRLAALGAAAEIPRWRSSSWDHAE